MSKQKSNREVEIKLRVASRSLAQRLLREGGFLVVSRRTLERNVVYDTPSESLRECHSLLRLRQTGARTILTWKGPPEAAVHKTREELEVRISDPAVFAAILECLGFTPRFRYEKYRTEYKRPRESGIVTLDETPIGVFLELEGSPRWIDRTALRLGFSPADYITASYGTLYLQFCEANGCTPTHMEFSRSGEGRKRRTRLP
jgi:adenylate cyclase class 2